MTALRSRTNLPPQDRDVLTPLTAEDRPYNSTSKTKAYVSDPDEGPSRLSLLDVLRVVAGVFLLSSALSYFITGNSILWGYRPAITRPAKIKAWLRGPYDLTDAQLSIYNGTDPALPILVAVNGTIYDVSASPHFYGPGGSYSFFAGRDATRSFVTGCFDTDLNGDLRGVEEMFMPVDEEVGGELTREERREKKLHRERDKRVARKKVEETVRGWERMFDGGKDGKYFKVGKVNRRPGSGWEGWGEVKELCAKAREGRPRRTAEDVG
ncbi:MAG: hypothetical protein ASARMPRED_002894 [Alectoria sarmentosa]|nr:MAG: hypothetical protein ASARMPRED_002894 [Alectoria sarmentosa]